MSRRNDRPDADGDLRARAEKAARASKDTGALSPEETHRALHELRVHQIELEMQNEELRRTQGELDAERARYFDLYDLAPVGYCTLSEKGLILEANLTAAKLLEVDRSALAGKPFSRFILREDQDLHYLHRKQLLETGEPQTCELRMLKTDGTPFWAHLQMAAGQGGGGAPVLRVVMGDISGRKRSEELLDGMRAEVENERFRLEKVMEVLPTGVAITDAFGGIVRANREFGRIWGGPRPAPPFLEDGAVLKGWWAETGTPLAPGEWASAQALRDGRAVVGQLLEIQRFDGTRAFVINSACPLYDVAGKINGSAVAVQDITSLRMADLRIQELNLALRQNVATLDAVNGELESYSHSVSHDLRTPLRFVDRIGHILLHEPGSKLSESAVRQVNMILQATGEMGKLIERLLVFSQASRVPLKTRPMDPRRLFQEVVRELQHAQEGFVVEIVLEDLPPCQADRTLLKEVAVNLLTNALKFTRRRESARITVGCTETGGETVYYVRDNGVGFDMSDAELMFVPFNRLRKSAGFEGTGIGLALVRRIIERHGGRIWAEGEIDKGATFYFTLGKEPAERRTASPETPAPEDGPKG